MGILTNIVIIPCKVIENLLIVLHGLSQVVIAAWLSCLATDLPQAGCEFAGKFCIAIVFSFIMNAKVGIIFYMVKTAIQAEICVASCQKCGAFYSAI